MKLRTRSDYRRRRHRRIRKRVSGTGERPRMALFKSNAGLTVQFVDDEQGKTLASARAGGGKDLASAEALGRQAAEAALASGIKQVVVDRGGFPFHGRIKAVVDAAVAGGLSIGIAAPPATEQPEAPATAEPPAEAPDAEAAADEPDEAAPEEK